MRLSKIKSLLAIISIVATFFFSEAKMQTKEIIFSSTDITSLSGTSSSIEIDGESVSLVYSSGTIIVNNVNCPDGIEDALGINIPYNKNIKGYLIMRFPQFKGLKVSKVEIETWAYDSKKVQLVVAPLNASGGPEGSFRKADTQVISPEISTLSTYIPMSYTPQSDDNGFLEYGLRLYFENQSSTSATIGLKSIKVTYDDGEPEDMELTVLLDGEPAEDGQLVEPGSVLTIDTGGAPDAQIAYRIGDANIDNLLPAEGLTLSKPGTFIYHFTAVANGYKEASVDFTFTILGKIVVDSETIDLARSAEQNGLTIFEPGSDEYETKNLWEEDDIQFFFNEGEEIRMERQEDGEVLLMLNPGAELQVSLIENSYKILTADIEGLHTENLEISILEDDDYSRSVKRMVSWEAAGQRATALLIRNIGSEPAGISTLALEIEKNIATYVKGVEATENPVPEYYDLTGHKVMNPENGIFVERTGNKARVVVIRH